MQIYLIGDEYRVDGVTGAFVEAALDADLPRYDKQIQLTSARNQYVSFQVVLDARSEGFIRDIDVRFTALTGKRGSLAADYEVFCEWFHAVEGMAIPDLLIPFGTDYYKPQVPQSDRYLPEQRVGALWVDLFVDRAAAPGRYVGQLTVTADGQARQFDISLKVAPVTVPDESLMIADLNNYADSISPAYPHLMANPNRYKDGSYLAVERQFYRMARDHRCLFEHLNAPHAGNPPETFAPELEGRGKHIRVSSWDAYDEHFGPYLDGSAFKGSRRGELPIEFLFTPFNLGWPANYENWGKQGFTTEYRRILWEYMRHFEEKGWTKTHLVTMLNNKKDYRFFPTTQDEIWYRNDEEVTRQYFEIVGDAFKHSHAKMIFRADESCNLHNHYDNDLGEHTDLWVANQTMFSWLPECVQTIKNRKSILWHYGWFGEGFTIDLPLTAMFSHPMLGFMTGTTGFCSFWNAVGFGRDPLDAPFVNGGQAIFYPGTPFPGAPDVLPSIRLKSLRNSMQLADLMQATDGLQTEARPPLKKDLRQVVNRHYGYDSMSAWWREKPPFMHLEPRHWDDYTVDYSELTNVHHAGRSPLIMRRIREDALRLMSAGEVMK